MMKITNMNKKIFVTGAGGYLGRHVVTALCDAGAQVLIPMRHAERVDSRAIRVDVEIFNGSPTIFEELGRPDACLHLAWRDGFVHNSDAHMSYLSDHYTFLKNMMEGGLKQVAIMGSMHEIGYYEGAIGEDTPCNPISMYGIAKNALRRASLELGKKYGVCVQWLRAYYITGDDRNNNSVFAKMLKMEDEGKQTFPFTSGKNQFDFIDVDELSNQIVCILAQDEVRGVIECCTGKPMSLGDRAKQFIEDNGLHIRLQYGMFQEPSTESPAVWGNPEKIRQVEQVLLSAHE